MIGKTLGHYEILEPLGAGGMGDVYRARDTNLKRDVAIKVLPEDLAADQERLARLEREAHLLAALNHPNIASIYSLEESDGTRFLVLELAEGQTLDKRLASGRLDIEEALEVAKQIAQALEAAHDQGIIHRDLKPSNVTVTDDGKVKVLDFGLAKAYEVADETEGDSTRSPTITVEGTGTGVIMGTAAYMSPEQAKGKPLDKRTDIFSFGCVLYEMLTGRNPFAADTVSEVMAAILKDEPDWEFLPRTTPKSCLTLLRRCLQKDPNRRLHDIADARIEIDEAVAPVGTRVGARPRQRVIVTVGSLATLGALLAILVGLNVGGLRHRLLGSGSGATGPIESLAVLPLENLSGDPEQEYFADGMTDELIAHLAQIGALRVISRTSVMQYKGARKPLPEIARELNVDAVVEGTVRRSEGRVLITVQLIDAVSDQHLWVNSFERDLRDVLALQNEVAGAIAREIKVALTPQEEARLSTARPVNPDAYEAYLRGRFHWNRRTEDDIKKAIEYLRQAIAIDSDYALAHAALADSYVILPDYSDTPPEEAYAEAEAAAISALEIDQNLAEPHTSLAAIKEARDWDWSGAETEHKRALELKPGYATAHHWYAFHLMFLGRHDESISEVTLAQELDPLSLIINKNVGGMLYHARLYDEAIEQLRKTLDLDSNFAPLHSALGEAYLQKGMYEEAIAESQTAITLSGGTSHYTALLGHAYAVAGERGEAMKIVGELNELMLNQTYVPPSDMARIYTALGEVEQAFEWLERAYEERDNWLRYLKVDPGFDGLRSDPRFQDLLRRMNFPE